MDYLQRPPTPELPDPAPSTSTPLPTSVWIGMDAEQGGAASSAGRAACLTNSLLTIYSPLKLTPKTNEKTMGDFFFLITK